MIYTIQYLRDEIPLTENRRGEWVPARPLSGPWIVRVKAAWHVLVGKADAFTWPEMEETR